MCTSITTLTALMLFAMPAMSGDWGSKCVKTIKIADQIAINRPELKADIAWKITARQPTLTEIEPIGESVVARNCDG